MPAKEGATHRWYYFDTFTVVFYTVQYKVQNFNSFVALMRTVSLRLAVNTFCHSPPDYESNLTYLTPYFGRGTFPEKLLSQKNLKLGRKQWNELWLIFTESERYRWLRGSLEIWHCVFSTFWLGGCPERSALDNGRLRILHPFPAKLWAA